MENNYYKKYVKYLKKNNYYNNLLGGWPFPNRKNLKEITNIIYTKEEIKGLITSFITSICREDPNTAIYIDFFNNDKENFIRRKDKYFQIFFKKIHTELEKIFVIIEYYLIEWINVRISNGEFLAKLQRYEGEINQIINNFNIDANIPNFSDKVKAVHGYLYTYLNFSDTGVAKNIDEKAFDNKILYEAVRRNVLKPIRGNFLMITIFQILSKLCTIIGLFAQLYPDSLPNDSIVIFNPAGEPVRVLSTDDKNFLHLIRNWLVYKVNLNNNLMIPSIKYSDNYFPYNHNDAINSIFVPDYRSPAPVAAVGAVDPDDPADPANAVAGMKKKAKLPDGAGAEENKESSIQKLKSKLIREGGGGGAGGIEINPNILRFFNHLFDPIINNELPVGDSILPSLVPIAGQAIPKIIAGELFVTSGIDKNDLYFIIESNRTPDLHLTIIASEIKSSICHLTVSQSIAGAEGAGAEGAGAEGAGAEGAGEEGAGAEAADAEAADAEAADAEEADEEGAVDEEEGDAGGAAAGGGRKRRRSIIIKGYVRENRQYYFYLDHNLNDLYWDKNIKEDPYVQANAALFEPIIDNLHLIAREIFFNFKKYIYIHEPNKDKLQETKIKDCLFRIPRII